MTKNNQDFKDFLRDEVNLNQSRLDVLHDRVRAVNSYLKDNLTSYQKMEPQGSFALGTLIKPVDDDDEYDADIQIVMNPNPQWEPKDYVNEIRRTLQSNKNYANKLRLKTRCVTVDYAGDFHLDVVPRVTEDGKHHVCNRIDNKLEETDGTGYRDWFNEQNRITRGNLKKVVRLLKYLRDHKNNYRAKSILLTTLAGNTIRPSDEGTEAVGSVSDTSGDGADDGWTTTCSKTPTCRRSRIPCCRRRTSTATGIRRALRQFQEQGQLPCADGQEGTEGVFERRSHQVVARSVR